MRIIESLLAAHPVRKPEKQKAAFRAWMLEQANLDFIADGLAQFVQDLTA